MRPSPNFGGPGLAASGQESVWDYPRPPAVRSSAEHVEVVLGGQLICRTDTSIQVLETSHPPTYYLPRSAFAADSLRPAAGSSCCEWKGRAAYLDLIGGGRVAPHAAWYYPNPNPGFAALAGHVALYPAAVDEVNVNGERVLPQPGGYYGGWITSRVVGPFKGAPDSAGW